MIVSLLGGLCGPYFESRLGKCELNTVTFRSRLHGEFQRRLKLQPVSLKQCLVLNECDYMIKVSARAETYHVMGPLFSLRFEHISKQTDTKMR